MTTLVSAFSRPKDALLSAMLHMLLERRNGNFLPPPERRKGLHSTTINEQTILSRDSRTKIGSML